MRCASGSTAASARAVPRTTGRSTRRRCSSACSARPSASAADDELEALLPAADKALAWVDNYGDSDGDEFVEYERLSATGLVNQGWKDSPDAINFADGRLASSPIALCEVQGYVYAAWRARADIAEHLGDEATAERCNGKADKLKAAFNERFYVESTGCFALALDGSKRQVDSITSNIGHLLWTGIVEDDHAVAIAEHLVSPELFTGWGVRTLSSAMAAYNPMSYHNGSYGRTTPRSA